MSSAIKTKINLGLFAFGVRLQKATEDEKGPGLDCLCEQGHRPKQRIECAPCQQSWTSWQGVPNRGYPKDGESKGGYTVVLTKTEMEEAKRNAPALESFDVGRGKLVDWDALTVLYGFADTYYVTPEEDVVSAKLYQVFLQALGPTRRALLVKYTTKGTPVRFALVANVGRGLLMALKVRDMRESEYEPPRFTVSDLEAAPVKAMLEAKYDADATFLADPDPVQDLLDARLEEVLRRAAEAESLADEKPLVARRD